MNNFENYGSVLEQIPTQESQTKRERLFERLICAKLLDSFLDDLYEVGIEDESDIKKALQNLSYTELEHFYAVPEEIRKRFFGNYSERIKNGEMTVEEMVTDVVKKNKEAGRTLGFHMSKFDIAHEGEKWDIEGTELDDRDDKLMAYYSLDYLNSFRKRDPNYIYIIRAETGIKSTHKRDLNDKWGRAAALSIIAQYNVRELDTEIEDRLKKLEKGEGIEEEKIAA